MDVVVWVVSTGRVRPSERFFFFFYATCGNLRAEGEFRDGAEHAIIGLLVERVKLRPGPSGTADVERERRRRGPHRFLFGRARLPSIDCRAAVGGALSSPALHRTRHAPLALPHDGC